MFQNFQFHHNQLYMRIFAIFLFFRFSFVCVCFISLFECKYKYIWWKQKKNNKKLFTAPLLFCPTNNVHIWWNKKNRRIWLIVCLENWYKFWTQTITNQSINRSIDQPLSLFSFQFFCFHLFKIIIKIVNFICFLCKLCYLNIENWKFEFECCLFFFLLSLAAIFVLLW